MKRTLAAMIMILAGSAWATGVIQLTPAGPTCTIVTNSPLHNPGSPASYAVDGITGTCFLSQDSAWQNWFIVLDLGSDYILDHYRVWYYTPNIGIGMVSRFRVGDVINGSGRVTAPYQTEDFTATVEGWNSYTATVTAVKARYIDVSVPNGSTGTGRTGGVYELQIFGSSPLRGMLFTIR